MCESSEVYTDKDITHKGESRQIPISSFTTLYLKSYICLSCGFSEQHISGDQLNNLKLIEKIKGSWKKVD
ncbi:MAG: hypothetical protein KBF96_09590 [Ignavibacteria bacterium]|nr:hypothetical protein [Ignavibacteria bacterium]